MGALVAVARAPGAAAALVGLAAVLWLTVVFLVLPLATRRSLGIATIPAAIALLVIAARDGHAALAEVVAYGLAWCCC